MIRKHHDLMWGFTKSLLVSLKRPVFVYLISLSLTVQLAFASVFYWLEARINPNVGTFFDSLYYTVTVMTGVGLGDVAAVTIEGKAFSMLMMLAGTAIYVCFTGVLAASILGVEEQRNKKK